MANTDWLDALLSGHLEVGLIELTFLQGDLPRYRGNGRLVWQAGSQVRVEAVTDGAQLLIADFGRRGVAPGKLWPRETLVVVQGKTQGDWEVTTDPAPKQGYTVHWDSPHVLWDFSTSGARFARPLPRRVTLDGRVIRALLGPPPKSWIRHTDTEVHNEYFGGRSSETDWLQASCRLGSFAARKRSDQWFELKARIEPSCATPALELVSAIATAFSLVQGRDVQILGLEEIEPDHETRSLLPSRLEPTKGSVLVPLSGEAYRLHVEALLGQAADFFLTERGRETAQYLHLCWDTADNDFMTRIAVLAISVEGLLRQASKSEIPTDPGYTPIDRDALICWLKKATQFLSPRFVKRMRGFISALGHRRPIDILAEWQQEGRLGITADDIKAYGDLRNPAAHGHVVLHRAGPEIWQREFDHYSRVANIMNRLVLHLIGYRGRYIDYSQNGWPDADFPPPASLGFRILPDAS